MQIEVKKSLETALSVTQSNTTTLYINTSIYRYIVSSLLVLESDIEVVDRAVCQYVALTLFGLRGLFLHEFMLVNISNPARVQSSAPSGASEHRNTLTKAL